MDTFFSVLKTLFDGFQGIQEIYFLIFLITTYMKE